MDRESELISNALVSRPPTIAVDLDATLSMPDGVWQGFHHIGDPNRDVIDFVIARKAQGYRIIIHTCRVTTLDNKLHLESLDTIRKWLDLHHIPYDEIWTTLGKPFASAYLDDKAVNPCCSECMQREASVPEHLSS